MKLTFLGTRGYIKPKNKKHVMHTSLLVSYKGRSVLIDCGESWILKIFKLKPHQILITHGHPDHAFGLKKGAPCPVWATQKTWENIKSFPIKKRKVIKPEKPFKIGSLIFEAFDVVHSIKAPAVGYKITAGKKKIFYVPDVAWIQNRKKAFSDIRVYIGDGATIFRNMIRKDKKTKELFGHANIRQELTWCKKEGIKKMIITHCGSDIVKNEKKATQLIKKLAKERNVAVEIAFDGMVTVI